MSVYNCNTCGKKPHFGTCVCIPNIQTKVEQLLEILPRMTPESYPKTAPNAWVYIDSIGRLNILPVDGGLLMIDEEDLDVLDYDDAAFAS